MLLQILDYFRREGVVSNQVIARYFNVELSALQPMLDVWMRRGLIRQCQQGSACQASCFKCKNQPTVYYTLC